MVHCIYIKGSKVIISIKCISFSEDQSVLANSADHDEMPHNATFHLGLHSVSQSTCFGGSGSHYTVGTQRTYLELKYFKIVKMREAKYSLKMAA